MDTDYLERLFNHLGRGRKIAAGLTDAEVQHIESRFGFQFPPDLRAFLQYGLPLADDFPNWRQMPEEDMRAVLAWPWEGIRMDIETGSFWMRAWGGRPPEIDSALEVAARYVNKAPPLLPVHVHCFIPARPCLAGNPVFALDRADVTCRGFDLPSYFEAEFDVPPPPGTRSEPRGIELWSALAEGGGRGHWLR